MNKLILTGRLTKDGEVRTTNNNQKVYINSIAVNRLNGITADGQLSLFTDISLLEEGNKDD